MNLWLHKLFFWLSLLAGFIGLYSIYIGWVDRHYHCLPHNGWVIVFYGWVEALMSFWLASRMARHLHDIQYIEFYTRTPVYDKQDWGRDA